MENGADDDRAGKRGAVMANGIDKSVRCPFYRSTSPKDKKIRCEGVSEVCTTHLAFSTHADYDAYMKTRCCRRYQDCGLFWALKDKYDQ